MIRNKKNRHAFHKISKNWAIVSVALLGLMAGGLMKLNRSYASNTSNTNNLIHNKLNLSSVNPTKLINAQTIHENQRESNVSQNNYSVNSQINSLSAKTLIHTLNHVNNSSQSHKSMTNSNVSGKRTANEMFSGVFPDQPAKRAYTDLVSLAKEDNLKRFSNSNGVPVGTFNTNNTWLGNFNRIVNDVGVIKQNVDNADINKVANLLNFAKNKVQIKLASEGPDKDQILANVDENLDDIDKAITSQEPPVSAMDVIFGNGSVRDYLNYKISSKIANEEKNDPAVTKYTTDASEIIRGVDTITSDPVLLNKYNDLINRLLALPDESDDSRLKDLHGASSDLFDFAVNLNKSNGASMTWLINELTEFSRKLADLTALNPNGSANTSVNTSTSASSTTSAIDSHVTSGSSYSKLINSGSSYPIMTSSAASKSSMDSNSSYSMISSGHSNHIGPNNFSSTSDSTSGVAPSQDSANVINSNHSFISQSSTLNPLGSSGSTVEYSYVTSSAQAKSLTQSKRSNHNSTIISNVIEPSGIQSASQVNYEISNKSNDVNTSNRSMTTSSGNVKMALTPSNLTVLNSGQDTQESKSSLDTAHISNVISTKPLFNEFYVTRNCLAHNHLSSVGYVRDYSLVLHFGDSARIIKAFKVSRHRQIFIRYEIQIGHHHYFVTGNHLFIKDLYYRSRDLRGKRRYCVRNDYFYKILLIKSNAVYRKLNKKHVRTLHRGSIVNVKKLVSRHGRTWFEMTNGHFIIANRSFVKLI